MNWQDDIEAQPRVHLSHEVLLSGLWIAFIWLLVWLSLFILDTLARNEQLDISANLAQRSVVLTERWLEKQAVMLESLAQDERVTRVVTQAASGGGEGDTDSSNAGPPDTLIVGQETRRALHEFSYRNKIDSTYLLTKEFIPVVSTASASPLPVEKLQSLVSEPAFLEKSGGVTALGGASGPVIITLWPITQSLSSTPLGYLATLRPLKDVMKPLQGPFTGLIGKGTVNLYQLQEGSNILLLEALNRHLPEPRMLNASSLALPISGNTTHTGLFEDRFGLRVIATVASLPDFPAWRMAVVFDLEQVLEEQKPLRNLLMMVGLILTCLTFTPWIWKVVHHIVEKRSRGWPAQVTIQGGGDSKRTGRQKKNASKLKKTPFHKDYRIHKQRIDAAQAAVGSPTRKNVLQEQAKKKIEKIPPSEAEVVYSIKNALRNKRIKFLYQPVVGADDMTSVMNEVYLRLFDEKGDMLSPATIFPVAGRNNLLSTIDEHVILSIIEKHLKHGEMKKALAINLTGDSFESIGFLKILLNTLVERPNDAEKFIFELRSREIIEDKEAMNFIKECRRIGCKFSVDYFGGGVKTIKAAKTLKFDYVKLDGLKFEPDTAGAKELNELHDMARTAKQVGLPLVMEKIETHLLVRLCQKLDIPYLQGYKIAKPDDRPV